MSDLAKLLQEHSATKLLHGPTRHVCNGCGQALTGTMADHQADVLDLAGYAPAPVSADRPVPTTQDEMDADRKAAADQLAELVHGWYLAPANLEATTAEESAELAQTILAAEWVPGWAYRRDIALTAAAAHASGHQHELDELAGPIHRLQSVHFKTADRLTAARATIKDQRATIAAQVALIDGMRSTLLQRRAVADTASALS
jgi:hypothetical protein